MYRFIQSIGALFLVMAFTVHFVLLAFIFSPARKLIPFAYSQVSIIDTSILPEAVQDFLLSNNIDLSTAEGEKKGWLSSFSQKVLHFRRSRIMKPEKALAYDLSLVNYNEGVIGIEKAADHYYSKPANQLSESEWMTLIHLHKIFSK